MWVGGNIVYLRVVREGSWWSESWGEARRKQDEPCGCLRWGKGIWGDETRFQKSLVFRICQWKENWPFLSSWLLSRSHKHSYLLSPGQQMVAGDTWEPVSKARDQNRDGGRIHHLSAWCPSRALWWRLRDPPQTPDLRGRSVSSV